MKYCVHCGAELEDDAQLCETCGAKQDVAVAEQQGNSQQGGQDEVIQLEQEFSATLSSFGDTAVITGLNGVDAKAVRKIAVPASIDGMSVTEIGDGAFNKCASLVSIEFPDSITSIASHAFDGCAALKEITLPRSLEYIGNEAFKGCSSLRQVNFHSIHGYEMLGENPDETDGIKLGKDCFEGCPSLPLKCQATIRHLERGRSPFGCFLLAYANYYNFTGRTTRREYWFFILFFYAMVFALAIVSGRAEGTPVHDVIMKIVTSFIFSSAIPALTAAIRRVRDAGKRWWCCLIPLYSLILFCSKTSNYEHPAPRASMAHTARDIILALATMGLITWGMLGTDIEEGGSLPEGEISGDVLFEVGEKYHNGEGVEQDNDNAVKCLQKAAAGTAEMDECSYCPRLHCVL